MRFLSYLSFAVIVCGTAYASTDTTDSISGIPIDLTGGGGTPVVKLPAQQPLPPLPKDGQCEGENKMKCAMAAAPAAAALPALLDKMKGAADGGGECGGGDKGGGKGAAGSGASGAAADAGGGAGDKSGGKGEPDPASKCARDKEKKKDDAKNKKV